MYENYWRLDNEHSRTNIRGYSTDAAVGACNSELGALQFSVSFLTAAIAAVRRSTVWVFQDSSRNKSTNWLRWQYPQSLAGRGNVLRSWRADERAASM